MIHTIVCAIVVVIGTGDNDCWCTTGLWISFLTIVVIVVRIIVIQYRRLMTIVIMIMSLMIQNFHIAIRIIIKVQLLLLFIVDRLQSFVSHFLSPLHLVLITILLLSHVTPQW